LRTASYVSRITGLLRKMCAVCVHSCNHGYGNTDFSFFEFIRVFHFDFAQYRPIRVNNSFWLWLRHLTGLLLVNRKTGVIQAVPVCPRSPDHTSCFTFEGCDLVIERGELADLPLDAVFGGGAAFAGRAQRSRLAGIGEQLDDGAGLGVSIAGGNE